MAVVQMTLKREGGKGRNIDGMTSILKLLGMACPQIFNQASWEDFWPGMSLGCIELTVCTLCNPKINKGWVTADES